MIKALLWGSVASFSLVIGGILACVVRPGKRLLGLIMAFGAGTLIAAVAYELVFESIRIARSTGFPALGFFSGAIVFYFSDLLIAKLQKRKTGTVTGKGSGLVIPMVLAIILDGIPESLVIGLGIFEDGTVSMAMLVAVFISNLPESIAGTSGMLDDGKKWQKIIGLWTIIAMICVLAVLGGYSLFTNTSPQWLAFIQSFAAGAILMMLTNSMIPEAYEHSRNLAGIFTVMGFALSLFMVLLEHFG